MHVLNLVLINKKGIYLQSSSSNTIENNNASSNNNNGICLVASSSNTIANNTASSNNNAIYLYSSSNSNTIVNNTAHSVEGGGIRGAGVIAGNLIAYNKSTSMSAAGGGIYCTAESAIVGNVVTHNKAEEGGSGIEVRAWGPVLIAGNVIAANGDSTCDWGLRCYEVYHDVKVLNNTIVLNHYGVELYSTKGTVANNVIAWNEAVTGGGGVDKVDSTLNFVANDTYGNLPDDYSPTWDPTGSDGNISLDPLFLIEDAAMDGYQPRSDSPLVDAADATLAPVVDQRAIPRPQDGDASGTPQHDIGARENEGLTRLEFISATELGWDPSVDPAALFNLYRGDLGILHDTGVYTQNPDDGLGARRWCDLGSPSASDDDEPLPQQVFFYLSVVENSVEGTLGFDGTLSERPFTDPNRCP